MNDTAHATRRNDARALQARLYREIGVAAVAAALTPAALAPAPLAAPTPEGTRPAQASNGAPAPRRAA